MTNISGALPIDGGTLLGALVLAGDPVSALQAAPKQYVDTAVAAVVAGLDLKDACYAATTANLAGYTYSNGASGVGATLTAGSNGAFATDGVSPPLNARILVKDQSTTAQNGIYILTQVGSAGTPAILTRSSDYDTIAEIVPGTWVIIQNGTANAVTSWIQTATVVTIGTDPITFVQFTGAAAAPTTATYILQTANGSLPNAQAMSALGTGLVKNTTATGVQSIAVKGTDYYGPSNGAAIPVSDGGLGVMTLTTAYGVICAGTTATGPVQTLASLGTSGYVLTSNGAGALPSFQANAGGSGAWVLLATVTASATASIDFTTNINSTYNEYRILGSKCKNTNSGVDLQMRISIASSFQTGAFYNFGYGYFSSGGVNGSGSATGTSAQMNVTGIGISTTSNRVWGFEVALKAPSDTASYKMVQWNLGYSRVTTEVTQIVEGMSVFTNSAAAVDGIQFYPSAATIASGVFYLYGIKK